VRYGLALAGLSGLAATFLPVTSQPVAPPGAATPPAQPPDGPGGSSYPHAAAVQKGPFWARGHEGDDNYRYFVYEPSDPAPELAPVILFGHGHAAHRPVQYHHWLVHMARKGYLVVWVQYQFLRWPRLWSQHALVAFRDAIDRLEAGTGAGGISPLRLADGRRATAFVGHSAGAHIVTTVAALASDSAAGIDPPAAIVAVQPGDSIRGWRVLPEIDVSRIDRRTKIVVIVGDEDRVVGEGAATALWRAVSHIDPANRAYYRVRSDRHGSPAQIGNHWFPNTTGYGDTASVDARDFFVTYKFSVAAADCAIFGRNCEYALGSVTAEQTALGAWSDGVPVRPLERHGAGREHAGMRTGAADAGARDRE
jgi:hypothetical protein